jgi:hypothetical protein
MTDHLLSGLLVNELPNINDVHALNIDDQACLAELRGVLQRYGLTHRFGIALLHKHFEVEVDEVLVEHCDVSARTLTASPMKRASLVPGNSVTTLWKFVSDPGAADQGTEEKECEKVCPVDAEGKHFGYKDHY